MAGGLAWSRRLGARARTLRGLVRDTQRALHDIEDILSIDPEVSSIVSEIGNQATRPTALVVVGNSARARVRLLHALIGQALLPEDMPRGCRWIRIQYGSTTQVHLSLGNSEFELVEELQCNKRPWEVLPVEDLLRHDSTDLTTILEVEINNQFLKDGLRIIIPPDIPSDPGTSNHLQLKSVHSELFSKRNSILQSFIPVYLYAIDKVGKNVFCDNICANMAVSRSDEDFWSSFNLYDMKWSRGVKCEDRGVWMEGRGEAAVFSSENCLDLHQIKELNPHGQLLFVLFHDAEELESRVRDPQDTESAETVYWSGDLPEADQGRGRDLSPKNSTRNRHVLRLFTKHPQDNVDLLFNVAAGNATPKNVLPRRAPNRKFIFGRWRERNTLESPVSKSVCDNDSVADEQTAFMNELIDQWELMTSPPQKHYVRSQWAILDTSSLGVVSKERGKRDDKIIKSRTALLNVTLKFAVDSFQTHLLENCTRLSEVHVKLLQQFILASFDMARELQIVPKKIQYVAIQEQHLYDTINEKFSEGDQKQELVVMMQEVLQEMKADVVNMDWSVDDFPWHQDQRFMVSNSTFYSRGTVSLPLSPSPSRPLSPSLHPLSPSLTMSEREASDGEEASCDNCCLDEYDIIVSSEESYSDYFTRSKQEDDTPSPQNNIRVENEDMFSLSQATRSMLRSNASSCTNTANVSVKHATLDVQRTVLSRLSRKISLKLVKFVDCLKENYFGTLQRCLESLETSCRQELGGRPATEAMRQLLSVGRQVELQPYAAFSLMRSLLDSLRRLLHKFRLVGSEGEGGECCVLSAAWRRKVALHAAHSLSAHRLARIISTQILERLSMAHEKYQSALTSLETALASRLHHTEDIKLAIRKKYAPTFARLCLESTSMCDLLMYKTPDLGREIGRGQYGVVYAARGGWGGHSPVAVKSVLPADERHYHELAMEFFYTRSIPPHPRIVRLYGSIVQKGGVRGEGEGRSVLLVSARAVRDLHAAVRAGLDLPARMRIACDIIQGIRYLHSLGLVHRDIKLKNVLLDAHNRASLSDLGFCSYGALMSGSVVGTPVHMAPELFNGDYCAMVDVYAFGILFWYLCAGDIKLPAAFEAFHNKEQLWSKVKKGLRPERLPQFTDECWELMQECWHEEPARRALPGDLQLRLQDILKHAMQQDTPPCYRPQTEEDSLLMTGVYDSNAMRTALDN